MIGDLSERDPVEVLAEEFLERRRRREAVTPEEYVKRFPALADRIQSVFPALLMLDECVPDVTVSRSNENPKQLGEFRIIRQIGRGGMGIVYEAVQGSLDRHVALKVLPAESARDAVYLDRFRSEARTAARLHHTNIVAIHGAGQADGVHFLVMQLINGVGLDAVLGGLRAKHHSIPIAIGDRTLATGLSATDDAVEHLDLVQLYDHDRSAYYCTVARLMAEAADALAHAHQFGVVHRDIKPSNLLLARNGSLFVSDFGLAKAEGAADLTRTGLVVGTPRYVAPERFNGGEGPECDVFALGATLYELLTLRPAFDAPTRDRLIEQLRNVEPTRPRSIVGDVPHDLETLALTALTKLPGRRPTAAAWAEDLHRWLSGRPIRARRVGPVERLTNWARRNPMVASLTTGLFFSMAVGLAAALILWRTSEAHRESAVKYADEADRQRMQSEESLTGAMDALDEYFTQVSESKLLNKPGLQPLRRDLLTSASRYYEGFLKSHADNPRLRREAARALVNLARLQLMVGDKVQASKAQEVAVDVCRKLIDELPDDDRVRRQLASACHGLAVVRLYTNQTTSACEYFRESAEHFARLPGVNDQQLSILSLLRAAEAANDLNLSAQAAVDVQLANQQLIPLLQSHSENPKLLWASARVNYLNSLLLAETRSAEALPFALTACSILEPLVGRFPESTDYRREWSRCLFQRGNCELGLKRPADAALSFTAARDLAARLHEENPEVSDFRLALANIERQSGRASYELGRYDEAIDRLSKTIRQLEQWGLEDPTNGRLRQMQARATYSLGTAYKLAKRNEDAVSAYRLSGDAYADLAQREPRSANHWANLGASRGNEASALRAMNDHASAAALAREAIGHQQKALALQPVNNEKSQLLGLLKTHFGILITCERLLDRLDDADATIQEFIAIFPKAADVYCRASREYALCSTKATPAIFLLSRAKADEFAAKSIAALTTALELDSEYTRKDFDPKYYKAMEKRDDYKKLRADLQPK